MAMIYISEAEAASDFAAVLARVRAGSEIVIENNNLPVAVVHRPHLAGLTLSELIARSEQHERETGQAPVQDAGFAADVEAVIEARDLSELPQWD